MDGSGRLCVASFSTLTLRNQCFYHPLIRSRKLVSISHTDFPGGGRILPFIGPLVYAWIVDLFLRKWVCMLYLYIVNFRLLCHDIQIRRRVYSAETTWVSGMSSICGIISIRRQWLLSYFSGYGLGLPSNHGRIWMHRPFSLVSADLSARPGCHWYWTVIMSAFLVMDIVDIGCLLLLFYIVRPTGSIRYFSQT